MAGTSTYLADRILNFWLRSGTWPAKPANIYVSLHTSDPGETGVGEVVTSGTGYARVVAAVSDATWSAPADAAGGKRRTANVNPLTFGNPVANWGVIGWVGFWDAASGGNLLWSDPLGVSRTVNAGDVAPSFAASILGVSVG